MRQLSAAGRSIGAVRRADSRWFRGNSGRQTPAPHVAGIVRHQLAGQRADFERPWANRSHWRHFGRTAGQETLFKRLQFLWPDRPLDHLDAAGARQSYDGPPGDSVKEAIGRWGVDFSIPDEEDIGPRRFGNLDSVQIM